MLLAQGRRDTIGAIPKHSAGAVLLCLGQEHGHADCCTCSLQCCSKSVRGLSCGVDIVYEQDFPAIEFLCIDVHLVLDVVREFVLASDVSPLAASADADVLEAVLCTRHFGEEVRESLPSAYV